MNSQYDVYMCRKQCNLNKAKKQAYYQDLTVASPFDRMPTELEKRGMMEIFKREYLGRFESE